MTDHHLDPDLLLALALDELAAPDRNAAVRHLLRCPDCRREYDELSRGVELALGAAPRVEPQPGFDRRALDAMGLSQDVEAMTPRRVTSSRWRTVAAAAAAGVVLGAGGIVAWNEARQPAPDVSAAVPLTTATGDQVGTVAPSMLHGRSVIIVRVTDGPAGKHYTCRLTLRNGREVDAEDWTLPPGGASWVLQIPASRIAEVELVADNGEVWSSAYF